MLIAISLLFVVHREREIFQGLFFSLFSTQLILFYMIAQIVFYLPIFLKIIVVYCICRENYKKKTLQNLSNLSLLSLTVS